MPSASKLADQINLALADVLKTKGLRAVCVKGDAGMEDDSVQFVRADGSESVVGVQVSNEGSMGSYVSIGVMLHNESETGVDGWVVRQVEGVQTYDVKAPKANAGETDPFMAKLASLLDDHPEMDPDKGPKQDGVISHPLAPGLFAALSGNEAVAAVRPFNDGDGGAEVDLIDGTSMRLSIGPGRVTAAMDDGTVEIVRNERGASFSDAVREVVRSASSGSAPRM